MNTDLTSLQATVYGRVQGVFFRDYVARRARELGLFGYVRNVTDGTVEVKAEGERQQLERLVDFLKAGPPAARVSEVVTNWSKYSGDFSSFNVRH